VFHDPIWFANDKKINLKHKEMIKVIDFLIRVICLILLTPCLVFTAIISFILWDDRFVLSVFSMADDYCFDHQK